jgi:phospholipid/cholesterol/gamma-HCH transport system permease protein
MNATSTVRPARTLVNPVGWLGRSVLAVVAYAGGVTLLAFGALGTLFWPRLDRAQAAAAPGFWKTLMHQLFWMLMMGVPLVGMVHVAMGSFLSLQAYYGSTFVDGTGAVVGVGLLRNLGGLMTGLTFAGILSARMVPELHILSRRLLIAETPAVPLTLSGRRRPEEIDDIEPDDAPLIAPGRLAAPRIVAAGIACLLLSQWGVAVGTLVGWQASQSMMGLPTETFFMMMGKMMWFRDVVGLVVKGLFFGALPALICCYEGLGPGASENEPASESISDSHPAHGLAPPWSTSVFRAACLSCAAILVMSSSWFILVYHAVPFYGPTLLTPQGP